MDISYYTKEQVNHLLSQKSKSNTMWKSIKRLFNSLFNRAKKEIKEAEEKAVEKIDEASEDVK